MAVLGHDLFAEVAQRLREASTGDRNFDAAQMHLINLPEIIARAGEAWPRVKDKIRASSVGFLKGCLNDADMVIPAGDGFLIIFAEGDTAELKLRAEELRALLLEFYLSQDALKGLGIEVEHRVLDAKAIGALLAPPPKPAADPITTSCLFAPVWSPGPQVIASYFCFPVHRDGEAPRYGYDAGFAQEAHSANRDYCELDIGLLDVVQNALGRYGPDDTRPAIGTSVHSTTMQNRHARAAYLERLSKTPPSLMKHLYIKIAEIEPGTPIINLADWAGMLRARVRNMLLEFHHTEAIPPNLSQVGVWGAGYQAPASAAEGGDIIPLVRSMRRWGDALSRERQRFFVDNLRRPGLVRLASEAGAHFITSDACWAFAKAPGGVRAAAPPGASQQTRSAAA